MGISKDQLSEDGRSLEQFECGPHQWKGVSVLDRNLMNPSVVNTESQGSILLPDEEKVRSSGG